MLRNEVTREGTPLFRCGWSGQILWSWSWQQWQCCEFHFSLRSPPLLKDTVLVRSAWKWDLFADNQHKKCNESQTAWSFFNHFTCSPNPVGARYTGWRAGDGQLIDSWEPNYRCIPERTRSWRFYCFSIFQVFQTIFQLPNIENDPILRFCNGFVQPPNLVAAWGSYLRQGDTKVKMTSVIPGEP